MSVTWSSPVVTKWVTITSLFMGQSPVKTVPACPVQIGTHHHIDVYIDINKCVMRFKVKIIPLTLIFKLYQMS